MQKFTPGAPAIVAEGDHEDIDSNTIRKLVFLVLAGLESDWQRSDHKDDACMDRNWETFHTLDIAELCQHHWQGDSGFQTSQGSTNAEVDAIQAFCFTF
jgi:hypothetical protein